MIDLQYTPFILPLALSSVFCLAMLAVAWWNRGERVALWFAATVVALLTWTVGYMFELMATGLQPKIAWADLQYVATVALPILWLQVVLLYARGRGLSHRMWLTLGVLGALITSGIFLNPGGVFRVAPSVTTHGSLTALHPDYGPLWSLGWVPFVYGLLLVSASVLVRAMLHTRRHHVSQSLALLVASLLPLAAGTVYAFGLSPWPDYNPAMAVVSVSGLLMAYALFSTRLFELAPLARDAVIEHLADGVLVVDLRGRLVDMNPAAVAAFPELSPERLAQPIATILARRPDVQRALRDALSSFRDDGRDPYATPTPWEVEVRGDGPGPSTRRIYSLLATPVRSGGGRPLGMVVVLRDVSERVGLLDEAVRMATTDGLTGALSRRRLLELGEQAMGRAAARSQPVTVLVFDVDHLKEINDGQGHAAGDLVLQAIAESSRSALRDEDLFGRLGGDEFCAVLPGADEEEGSRIAERVRSASGGPGTPGAGGGGPHSTVSVGVATTHLPVEGRFEALLEAADGALYAAKSTGRDRVAVAGTGGSPSAEVPAAERYARLK